MAGYTKLFGSILDSTVWRTPPHVRLVWITMLAMSDRDGVVEASVPGLAWRAGVSMAEADDALLCLLSPDEHSRTPDYEGRRIEPVDGGWRLLNHAKYREKASADEQREKARVRMAAKRARDAAKNPVVTSHVTPRYAPLQNVRDVRQADPSPSPDPTPTPNTEISERVTGEGLILSGFQKRWQAHRWQGRALGDMWPGVGPHMAKVERWAPWAIADPLRLYASLDGYFACRDDFVAKVRWNIATWLADPQRYVTNDPGDAAAFGHTGVRYLTDEEVLGGE
jgi:hypothetical protein